MSLLENPGKISVGLPTISNVGCCCIDYSPDMLEAGTGKPDLLRALVKVC